MSADSSINRLPHTNLPPADSPGAAATLRRRIIVVGALLIAAIGVSAGYTVWRSYQRTLQDADREIGNLSRALGEHTARTFQQIDLILRYTVTWFQDPNTRDSGSQSIHQHLNQQIAGVPQIRALNIDDASGQQIHTSRGVPPPPINASDRSFFVLQRDDPNAGLYIAEPVVARADGKWAVAATRRLSDARGRFAGVVVSTTEPEYFERFYAALKLGAGSRVALFRSDGVLLAQYPSSGALGRNFDFVPRLLAATPAEGDRTIRMKSPFDGADTFITLRPVAGFPLAIAVSRDARIVLADWLDHAMTIGVITVSLSLMTLLLIRLFTRNLTRLAVTGASLRESEQRWRAVFEHSPLGIVVAPLRGGVLTANPAYQRIIGYTADELRTMSALDVIHPDDIETTKAYNAELLAGRRESARVEKRYLHKDGHAVWANTSMVRVDATANLPAMIVVTVEDITERKRAEIDKQQLESQLRQSQKMEAMGTLAGGIAHDFNNILAAILGYGEMAQKSSGQGTATRRYIDNVLNAGHRAKALVERILAFSRSGVGERRPFRVESVVAETIDMLRASLPAGIQLEVELEADNASVMGDATQMHQAVMNLCTNAMQAMEAGGALRVRLEAVTLQSPSVLSNGKLQRGKYVLLTVADSGTGMEPEVLERIFDPFFTTKPVGEGTGLGLSLVHGIVSDMDGAIDVHSRLRDGTTFELYLPITDETGVAPVSIEAEAARGHGEAVMLVDDERMLVTLGEEMLAELGYEAVGFTSVAEALAAFRSDTGRFDLLVTDETMPTMTGTELAREIRAMRPDMPVILVSGYSSPALAEKARSVGIRMVLGKPLDSRDIAMAIASALRPA